MSTRDLIDAIAAGSYTDAEDAFANVMNQKVGDAIDDMQVAVAKSMFQTEEEVEIVDADAEVEVEDSIDADVEAEPQEEENV